MLNLGLCKFVHLNRHVAMSSSKSQRLDAIIVHLTDG